MKIAGNLTHSRLGQPESKNPPADSSGVRRENETPTEIAVRKPAMLIMANRKDTENLLASEFEKVKSELRSVNGLFSQSEQAQWEARIKTLATMNGQLVKSTPLLVARQCKAFSAELARAVKNKRIEKMRNVIKNLPADIKREAMEGYLDQYKKAVMAPDPTTEKALADACFGDIRKEIFKGVDQTRRIGDSQKIVLPLLDSKNFNPDRWPEIFRVGSDMKKVLERNARLKEEIFNDADSENLDAAHTKSMNLQSALMTALRDIGVMSETDKKLTV